MSKTFPLGFHQEVNLSTLLPCRYQTRRFDFDDSKDTVLLGMGESIKVDGVIEPVVARNHPDKPGHLELAAGERRLRASALAGKKTIPCIVRDLDDDALFRVCVVENVQREELRPLEEAAAYKAALDRGWTLEQCSREFGYTARHIALRAQLTKLSPKWTKLISSRESVYSKWPIASLEYIARLAHDTQDALLENYRFRSEESVPTPTQVRNTINSELHIVSLAPWKEDDAGIGRACAGCPQRTDAQPDLFEGADLAWPENGAGKKSKRTDPCVRCLNTSCWQEKEVKLIKRTEAELKKSHKEVLFVGNVYSAQKKFQANMHSLYQLTTCKQSAPNAVPAICVNEHDHAPGTVLWVEAPKAKKTSSSSGSSSGAAKSSGPKPEFQRANYIADEVMKRIDEKMEAAREGKEDFSPLHMTRFIAGLTLTSTELEGATGLDQEELLKRIFHSTEAYFNSHYITSNRATVDLCCLGLDINITAIEAEAHEKFPDAPVAGKPAKKSVAKAEAKPEPYDPSLDDDRIGTQFEGDGRVSRCGVFHVEHTEVFKFEYKGITAEARIVDASPSVKGFLTGYSFQYKNSGKSAPVSIINRHLYDARHDAAEAIVDALYTFAEWNDFPVKQRSPLNDALDKWRDEIVAGVKGKAGDSAKPAKKAKAGAKS